MAAWSAKPVVMFALALSFGACGPSPTVPSPPDRAPAVDRPSTRPGLAVTPSGGPQPPAVVRLRPLPPQGLVIGRPGGVDFVDLSGAVVDRLSGFHLYYDWTVPGPVILRSHRIYYELDVPRHLLRPFASRDAAARSAPQFQQGVDPMDDVYLDVERPAEASPDAGFWAYTLSSPDGSSMLGQWSGECEFPTAFFLEPDGTDPVAAAGARGEGWVGSHALGWTRDGRALIALGETACGPGPRRGVYRFDGPGSGHLLIPLPLAQGARMWGPV